MGIVNLFSEKETLSMDRFECDFEFGEEQIIVKERDWEKYLSGIYSGG